MIEQKITYKVSVKILIIFRKVFDELVKYHGSAHISSANLMTCMGALTNIAKLRPEFLSKVTTLFSMPPKQYWQVVIFFHNKS